MYMNYSTQVLNNAFKKGLETQYLKAWNLKIPLLWKVLNLRSSGKIMGMKQLYWMVYIAIWNSCIWLFLFSDLLLQNKVQINSWSQRVYNWTQSLSWILLFNSPLNVNYELKSYGSLYERPHDDKVE